MVETGRAAARRNLLEVVVPALLVTVGVIAGILLTVQRLPDRYASSAVVSFSPREERYLGADAMQLLAARYVASLSAPVTLRTVAIESRIDLGELKDAVNATIEPGTLNMSIVTVLPDPATAAAVSNRLAATAQRQSASDKFLRAEVVAVAVVPNAPSDPNRSLLSVLGVLLGLVLGGLTAFGAARYRRRIRRWLLPSASDLAESAPIVIGIESGDRIRPEIPGQSEPRRGSGEETELRGRLPAAREWPGRG